MKKNKSVLLGVCADLGDKTDINPNWIRLGFVASFLFFGIGPLIYIIMWILMQLRKGR
jgi:phage shock protein PspC (stress-responsive transcriptional regulator)